METTASDTTYGAQGSVAQTTTPDTSFDEEIISPLAKELLATSSEIPTTAAPDTATATTALPDTAVDTTATAPDTADASTAPQTQFYSSMRTYARNGTNPPTASFADTTGVNGQWTTRTGQWKDGKWETKTEGPTETSAPAPEWENTVSELCNNFFGAHRPFVVFPFGLEEPFGETMADNMLQPMFPLALTLFADPVFRSVMAQSMLGPSLLIRDPFLSPWAGRRAMDKDTMAATAPSAIDTSTSVPMISAN